jgi:hypothetical protein
VIKRLRGCRISSKLIQWRAKTAGQVSVRGVDRKTAEAKQERLQRSEETTHASNQVAHRFECGPRSGKKTTAAQEKENYIRREEQKIMARQIKRVNGKLRVGSVTSVIASSPHDPNLRLEMGVQGLPSNNYYLFQEPMEELLKAQLHVPKQWLASTQSAETPCR